MSKRKHHIQVLRGMIESRCYTADANEAMAAAINVLSASADAVATLENFIDVDGGVTTRVVPMGRALGLPIGKYELVACIADEIA